jgi:hypothetical protein
MAGAGPGQIAHAQSEQGGGDSRTAWKSLMRVMAVPPLPSAAADILSARTRSTGYMRVAVDSAPAVIGGSSLKDIASRCNSVPFLARGVRGP